MSADTPDFCRPEANLADSLARQVLLQGEAEMEYDSLVASIRRRRHQQLAVHQLVTRHDSDPLLGESLHVIDRPGVWTQC